MLVRIAGNGLMAWRPERGNRHADGRKAICLVPGGKTGRKRLAAVWNAGSEWGHPVFPVAAPVFPEERPEPGCPQIHCFLKRAHGTSPRKRLEGVSATVAVMAGFAGFPCLPVSLKTGRRPALPSVLPPDCRKRVWPGRTGFAGTAARRACRSQGPACGA
ncbi:hypothetical protein OFAG_02278 [Oxalobacter formigenes HOxBLS]|uniref:Uncharacterized protein n=1 Tax=Oxalobacter paraformigenes TaxID=556268 RepID=T5LPM9_9BURK|nr:hypothetical protein OFAG_02278 [Oxalobacter paraformigenes]